MERELQCMICLEQVFIPVEITIFPCCKKSEKHCYSLKRLCESCVIKYLELNYPMSKRKSTVKCIFCQETINPQHIIEKPYKKDYIIMSIDKKIYKCKDCLFEGSHIEMERHKEKGCIDKKIYCYCNTICQEMLSEEHKRKCEFFKECLVCNIFVYRDDLDIHMKLIHDMTLCKICLKPTYLSLVDHNNNECIYRNIACIYCSEKMYADQYMDHLIQHTSACQTRINLLKEMLHKETSLYNKLTNDIEILFEMTYGISYHS
jgi:hypothetical protein